MMSSAATASALPLDLPALPAGWHYAPLAELVDPARGIRYGIVQPGQHKPLGIPIVRVNDIRNGRINDADPLRVAEMIDQKYHRTRLCGGEVLLTLVGTVGESAIVPAHMAGWNVARAVAVLPMNGTVTAEWVNLCLRSQLIQHYIRVWCTTTVQVTFNLRDVARLPIPIPPKKERERITDILTSLDDKIELNRRMNETLEAMARRLFKSWFVDFDPVHAKAAVRRQHPDWPNPRVTRTALPNLDPNIAELFPDTFEDSTLGPIPKGWRAVQLREHVQPTKGLSYKGSGLAPVGLPMHNLNSILEGGGYKFDGIKHYTGEHKERHVINSGELIVANTEQGHDRLLLGFAAIVPDIFGPKGLFSHHTYRLRLVPGSPLTIDFLCRLLNSPRMHDQVSRFGNGTTVNMLPIDALEIPQFVLPHEELMQVYSEFAKTVRQHECQALSDNRRLSRIRDKLLPKLLSGETLEC